jgi:hypothetical protein
VTPNTQRIAFDIGHQVSLGLLKGHEQPWVPVRREDEFRTPRHFQPLLKSPRHRRSINCSEAKPAVRVGVAEHMLLAKERHDHLSPRISCPKVIRYSALGEQRA